MKFREFNRVIKSITFTDKKNKKTFGLVDRDKAKALPISTRQAVAMFLIRTRVAVMAEFVDDTLIEKPFDISWLNCMGYLYKTTNKAGYTYYHTCEQVIK